ncbi:MAG: transcriptional regulator [Prevotella sp.]|nr:transcriptional regulator [Prevotella sp.]
MEELIVIGDRLKRIRKFLGLTQDEVARSANVSQAAVSRIEHGEEVYASVLLALVIFYQSQNISTEVIFNPQLDITQKEESTDVTADKQKLEILSKIDTIREDLSELYTDIHTL